MPATVNGGQLMEGSRAIPLCVDLDGTLIKTDSLAEAALQLVRDNPLNILRLIIWLFAGKAQLKQNIAVRTKMDPSLFPYNEQVLAYLRSRQSDRHSSPIYLATGSNAIIAQGVADHLNLFDGIIASDASTNMVGETKRQTLVQRFGEKGFDYMGDSKADWSVWPSANQAMLVSKLGAFKRRTSQRFDIAKHFALPTAGFRSFAKAIRVHQWVKNLLIFIPVLLEHRLFDVTALLSLTICFACLSLFASATYLINDMLDLNSDRQNSTKRHRALASGLISPAQAVIAIVLLLLASLLLAQFLPPAFLPILLIYGVVTLSYSLFLKKVLIVDVCVLASLFTLRIIGGVLVVQAEVSFWLLAFSMFFFLSLAIGKRASELANAGREMKQSIQGRGYVPQDLSMLSSAGTSAGFMSVLVVALYINSDRVVELYQQPEILWLVCPLLLYWIGRFWLIVSRGGMHEDPIIFAIRDRTSLLTVLCGAMIVLAATVMTF